MSSKCKIRIASLLLYITVYYGSHMSVIVCVNHRISLLVRNITWKAYKTLCRGGNLLGKTIFLLRTAICLWQMMNTTVSLTTHMSSTCRSPRRALVPGCQRPHGEDLKISSITIEITYTHEQEWTPRRLSSAVRVYEKHKSGKYSFNLLMCKNWKEKKKHSCIHIWTRLVVLWF